MRKRMPIIEILLGLISIAVGSILLWWSRQLIWIQVYPPPWERRLIEALPWIFWILGALLIIDGLRRTIRSNKGP